jgi:hypothetical protein
VYATFEASAQMLEQSENEDARDTLSLLAILSMLSSAFLPSEIFQTAWLGSRLVCQKTSEQLSVFYLLPDHVLRLPGFLVADNQEWDDFRLSEAISTLASLS